MHKQDIYNRLREIQTELYSTTNLIQDTVLPGTVAARLSPAADSLDRLHQMLTYVMNSTYWGKQSS